MALPPEIAAWRKAERARLLALRAGITPERRRACSDAITQWLLQGFPMLASMAVSFYWPFKGEFDPRFSIRSWRSQGARVALPVVLQKDAPLQFRQWWPGVRTCAGVYDLPVPQGSAIVVPDVVLIPPIGFDSRGFRLGYGGGYFDRTLAALSPQPLKIGVGFALSHIETIRPQPHDIPMDFVVTEVGIHRVRGRALVLEPDMDKVRAHAHAILCERALPRGAGFY